MENSISFAKIVSTPTFNSWSQAYNAGKLFAVLSLEKTQEVLTDLESLNVLGKDLFERLEQEFFTIEEKNLESIKKAIGNTFQDHIEGVNLSFAAGAFIKNVLYLFALGEGKVFIKRGGNFGLILDSVNNSLEIASSSGFLKEEDLIVLATDAFAKIAAGEDLNLSLDYGLPSEIAESLAPKIHKAEDGKASAIIIKYANPQAPKELAETSEAVPDRADAEKTEKQIQTPADLLNKYLSQVLSKLKRPNFRISRNKKFFLSAAIVIVVVLIFNTYLAIQKQNEAKMQALFEKIYPEALKKYDEGQSLLDLNKNLARDSFNLSQKILQDNKDKFPTKSKENTQIRELLKKVDDGLVLVSPVDKSGLDRSKLLVRVENGSGIEGTAGKAGKVLRDIGYNVVSTGNADNYNYQGATIKVKKDKSSFLNLLKKDLAKDYKITSSSSDLPPTSLTDTLIIIGK